MLKVTLYETLQPSGMTTWIPAIFQNQCETYQHLIQELLTMWNVTELVTVVQDLFKNSRMRVREQWQGNIKNQSCKKCKCCGPWFKFHYFSFVFGGMVMNDNGMVRSLKQFVNIYIYKSRIKLNHNIYMM